jgi:hypothetical protein
MFQNPDGSVLRVGIGEFLHMIDQANVVVEGAARGDPEAINVVRAVRAAAADPSVNPSDRARSICGMCLLYETTNRRKAAMMHAAQSGAWQQAVPANAPRPPPPAPTPPVGAQAPTKKNPCCAACAAGGTCEGGCKGCDGECNGACPAAQKA